MVNVNDLVIGKPYFIFRFFDMSIRYPKIDTMIYIGKCLPITGYCSDKEEYFFQDPMTYSNYGILLEHDHDDVDNQIIAIEEEDLDGFYDGLGLIEELKNVLDEQAKIENLDGKVRT